MFLTAAFMIRATQASERKTQRRKIHSYKIPTIRPGIYLPTRSLTTLPSVTEDYKVPNAVVTTRFRLNLTILRKRRFILRFVLWLGWVKIFANWNNWLLKIINRKNCILLVFVGYDREIKIKKNRKRNDNEL